MLITPLLCIFFTISDVTQAASDLSLSQSQVQVVSVQPKNWPDSALGCPQPGMAASFHMDFLTCAF